MRTFPRSAANMMARRVMARHPEHPWSVWDMRVSLAVARAAVRRRK